MLARVLALTACVTAACGDLRTAEPKPKAASPSTSFSLMGPEAAYARTRLSGDCSIDLVNGKPAGDRIVLPAGATVHVEGWAADSHTRSVPAKVALVLRGSARVYHYYAYAQRGVTREDVANGRGIAAFAKSGYVVSASTAGMQPGRYLMQIYQRTSSGLTQCGTGKTIEVAAR